jgi:hypothetical protein
VKVKSLLYSTLLLVSFSFQTAHAVGDKVVSQIIIRAPQGPYTAMGNGAGQKEPGGILKFDLLDNGQVEVFLKESWKQQRFLGRLPLAELQKQAQKGPGVFGRIMAAYRTAGSSPTLTFITALLGYTAVATTGPGSVVVWPIAALCGYFVYSQNESSHSCYTAIPEALERLPTMGPIAKSWEIMVVKDYFPGLVLATESLFKLP